MYLRHLQENNKLFVHLLLHNSNVNTSQHDWTLARVEGQYESPKSTITPTVSRNYDF